MDKDPTCLDCECYGEDGYYDPDTHEEYWIGYCSKHLDKWVAFDDPACEDFKED